VKPAQALPRPGAPERRAVAPATCGARATSAYGRLLWTRARLGRLRPPKSCTPCLAVHRLHVVPRAGPRRAPASRRACACTRQLAIGGLRRGSSWSTRPPSWASSCSPPCRARAPLCLGESQSRAPTASMTAAGSNPAPPPPTSCASPWPSEPFLHVLTTLLEPTKPLAHLHGRPTRRSRGRGGRRSTTPLFSIAGAPPDARNDKKSNPRRAYTTPPPFPCMSGLLLAGFRPSSSLSAVSATLQALSSFQGSRCKNQGPSFRVSAVTSKTH
jgi:hypothetical protein